MKYLTQKAFVVLVGMMYGSASQAADGPFAGRDLQLVDLYQAGVYPSSFVEFTVPATGAIQFDWMTDKTYRAAPVTVKLIDTGSSTGTVTLVETLPSSGNYAPSPNLALFSFTGSPGGPALKAVTLDTATTSVLFDPARVQFTDTMFSYDLGGLEIVNGGLIRLNITTVSAVPEPKQAAMLLLGLGVIGYIALCHKSQMQHKSS
ncbi:MAG: hypothetical protein JNL87_06585 [Burkholderiaceae bacterium]|nr:hypothetical protein [Burkholderiaceae bacterium]